MSVADDQGPTIVSQKRTNPRGGAKKGEVLGERYEIHDHIRTDAFTDSYRAIDQESERAVLVHIVDTSLLPERDDASRTLKRLRAAMGYGGKYLPGIVSAEAEGQRVMAVEPWPIGTRLRDVLDARAARAEPFTLRELLPVVAYLDAALAALPDGHRHGSVIAERVYVAEGEFRLAGGFLVAALPESAVSAVVGADPRLRLAFAPEVLQGGARRSSDLYSAACIVFEALFGRLPAPDEKPPSQLGPVSIRLGELLRRDTYARPARLHGLIRAIAEAAELAIPDVDPEKFDRRAELLRTEPDAKALADDDGAGIVDPATVPFDSDAALLAATDPQPFVEATADEDYLEDMPTEAGAEPASVEEEDGRDATQVRGAPQPSKREVHRRAIPGAAREGTMEIDASQLMDAAPEEALDPGKIATLRNETTAPELAAPAIENADDTAPRPALSLPVDRTGEIHESDLELIENAARALGVEEVKTTAAPARARSIPAPVLPAALVTAPHGSVPPGAAPSRPSAAAAAPSLPSLSQPSKPAPAKPSMPAPAIALGSVPPPSIAARPIASAPASIAPLAVAQAPVAAAPPHVALAPAPALAPNATAPSVLAPVPQISPEAASAAAFGSVDIVVEPASADPAFAQPSPSVHVAPAYPVRRDATPKMAFHERTHAEIPRRKRPPSSNLAGWLILIAAMIVASLIVATGMWISAERTRTEQERRLRERYEQIRRRDQDEGASAMTP